MSENEDLNIEGGEEGVEEVEAGDEDLEVNEEDRNKRAEGGAAGELEEVQEGEDRPPKRSKAPTSFVDELQEVDVGARGNPDVVPSRLKGLRACLICGLIKTVEQFVERGCENCDRHVSMRGDKERIQTCTTARFQGMIAMMDASKSWVARYQRFKPNFVPGCYAVSVVGQLPEEVEEVLRDANYNIVARDFLDRSVVTKK